MNKNNKYTKMQRKFYNNVDVSADMKYTNHKKHNMNPDYWDILLSDIPINENKIGLDFGCGGGRNVLNLIENFSWGRVDGVDISYRNIKSCKENLSIYFLNNKVDFYVNTGVDVSVLKSNEYDFIMSTIVLQHICVYDIRKRILKDLYRTLKTGGLLSFQMGFGNKLNSKYPTVNYFENAFDAKSTNGQADVRVESANQIIDDLKKIEFENITYKIRNSWRDPNHDKWIFVKAYKVL